MAIILFIQFKKLVGASYTPKCIFRFRSVWAKGASQEEKLLGKKF